MSGHFSKKDLRKKQRNELVNIANKIGIEDLFGDTTSEIADKIYEKVNIKEDVDLGGYGEKMKSKLMRLSRSDLVELGRKADLDKMFSMSMEEIAEEICNIGYELKRKSNIEEEVKMKISKRGSEKSPEKKYKDIYEQGEESKLVSRYATEIKNARGESEAIEKVGDFQSEIGNFNSELYDKKMESLFHRLSPSRKNEVRARESIVGICSTARVSKGGEMADWVYDLYKKLGYPVEGSRALSRSDLGFNLNMGEKYLAEEIPYQRT